VLVACGDGSVRRLEGLAPTAAATWAGEPLVLPGDAVGAFALGPDGTLYAAGEAVTAARSGDGARLWRTWFAPGGSLTVGEDDRYFAAGAGAELISYSDGTTARDGTDPAVRANAVPTATGGGGS
jgi:hypothetical protein